MLLVASEMHGDARWIIRVLGVRGRFMVLGGHLTPNTGDVVS
jgi:hypothetical protein